MVPSDVTLIGSVFCRSICALAVCGRFRLIDFCTTIVSMDIMKKTRRKKMISIIGMIMIFGFFSTFIDSSFISDPPLR